MLVPELVGQVVQAAEEPVVALNVPAAQAATLEPNPVYPASALQSPSASDPAGLPELVEHEVHVSLVCAVLALYFPPTQSLHATADDAVALNVPAAQAVTLEPSPV